MLNEAKLPDKFWRDVVYTIVYILNRAKIRANHDKMPFKLWFGKPSSVKHFRAFGRKCYIEREVDKLRKIDSRYDEIIILGYSSNKKYYRCYNQRLQKIVESINVKIYDLKLRKIRSQYK
jgi:hypothetical protein